MSTRLGFVEISEDDQRSEAEQQMHDPEVDMDPTLQNEDDIPEDAQRRDRREATGFDGHLTRRELETIIPDAGKQIKQALNSDYGDQLSDIRIDNDITEEEVTTKVRATMPSGYESLFILEAVAEDQPEKTEDAVTETEELTDEVPNDMESKAEDLDGRSVVRNGEFELTFDAQIPSAMGWIGIAVGVPLAAVGWYFHHWATGLVLFIVAMTALSIYSQSQIPDEAQELLDTMQEPVENTVRSHLRDKGIPVE
ncbi:MAG: hypothetical protein ABEJ65_01700 [bacterium]